MSRGSLVLIFGLALCSLASAGTASGGGGGDQQLLRYLTGPVVTARNNTSPAAANDEKEMTRIFHGSTIWGLNVLEALVRIGYDFELPLENGGKKSKPEPLTLESLQKARSLVEKVELTFEDSLKDREGLPVWAVNDPAGQRVQLNKAAWVYSGQNLRATCVAAFNFPFEISDPRSLTNPQPVMNVGHCYRMLAAAIATHEILSLLGLEGDRRYPYSSALLLFVGSREQNKGKKWSFLLAERDRINSLTRSAGEEFLKSFETKLRRTVNAAPLDASFSVPPVSDPWMTLAFAYFMEPIEGVSNKVLFLADYLASPRTPKGTTAYQISPLGDKNADLATYLKDCQNYSDMRTALEVIDTSRRLTLRAKVEIKSNIARAGTSRAFREGPAVTWETSPLLFWPERPVFRDTPHDNDILSINDYYRTAGYWALDIAVKAARAKRSQLAGAAEAVQVQGLLEERVRLENVLKQIAYESNERTHKILVIDYVANLTKNDLAKGERAYSYYGWRHLQAASYMIYQMSKKEKRPFIETAALDRLFSLVGQVTQMTEKLEQTAREPEAQTKVSEVRAWLDAAVLDVEILGGLGREIAYEPLSEVHSFRVQIDPTEATWWSVGHLLGYLEKAAGQDLYEYGAKIHISQKQADGSFVITSYSGEMDCASREELIKRLDPNEQYKNTSYNKVKVHPVLPGLAKYLTKNPKSFRRGICTDGVELKFRSGQFGDWSILSGNLEPVLLHKGIPKSVKIFAPREEAKRLKEGIEKNVMRASFSLSELKARSK